jgi:AcrR family transcriptional regulator
MVDRRIERGQATRQRLVTVAREFFGERGYDATSIEAVLEASGMARGALYHHFANKEALFDAVLEGVVAEIAATAGEAAQAVDDPVDSLRAGCCAWLRMALDPAIQRIALLDPPSVVGWTRWRELDEQYTLGGLKAGLRRIVGGQPLAAGDIDMVAHILLASVSEAALMIARADDPDAALVAGQNAVDMLINGLAR